MTTSLSETPMMWWARLALYGQLAAAGQISVRETYRMLEMYYYNNGLYDALRQAYYDAGTWTEAMKGLRNPVHRAVEFYPAKLCPGSLDKALPIVAANERILSPIQQVWAWSNFGNTKQLAARWFAMFGDWFVKVAAKTAPAQPSQADGGDAPAPDITKVYFQQIKPEYVSELEEDEMGNLTYIRTDSPVSGKDAEGRPTSLTHTEIWSKFGQLYRMWEHKFGNSATLAQLGTPIEARPLSDFGIDFVPFVRAKFQDVGENRGASAVWHALDKIDEANRQATKLHKMLFRYGGPLWGLQANMQDASGRPLPAPRIEGDSGGVTDTLTIGEDTLVRLPGMSTLAPMIPDIQYADALNIIAAQIKEIEQDLPELTYWRIADADGGMSGKALRTLLLPAEDKCLEARGNFETALSRADAMALTMGVGAGLFSNIGVYENGDFEHSFAARPVFAEYDDEKAANAFSWTKAGAPTKTAFRRVGWTEAELDLMNEDAAIAKSSEAATLAQAMAEARRRFDQGSDVAGNDGSAGDDSDADNRSQGNGQA